MSADSAPLTHLRLERPSPGVARLVLDNPDQRNAMSDDMTRSWGLAIDALAADPEVRVVVVTGEGSAFCAGGDPRWIASDPDAPVDRLRPPMIAVYPAGRAHRRIVDREGFVALVAGVCRLNGRPIDRHIRWK